MATPPSQRHSSRASAGTEKCSGPDATLPGVLRAPRSSVPVSRPPHSAAPRARETHFSPWYQGYGSSAAHGPGKHVSSADTAAQFPWPTYYSSATPPSTPHSNPDSPPPRERIFLLPPRSAPWAASSSAAAAAYNASRLNPTTPRSSKSAPAYSAHGSRKMLLLPAAFAAGIPENAQYGSATATRPQTLSANFLHTIHTSRWYVASCCAFS